ncbi:unnamed protein product [Mytilus edulis]|uniref:C-type lectin domain-containing protein n=1 Tax=Mytilus edulis TaxID=6550 RepID=A0A8S3T497_MYTED|nr:unnamed protein product [Mytilus edulis]
MAIRCFLFSATVYVITVCLLYAVNINAKDVESFQTKGSTRAIRSVNTSDFDSTSLLVCAQKCLSHRQCCVASFSKGTSTCRLDTSEKCCIDTETKDGWRTIRRNNYLPINCTGSITFGTSTYSIIPDYEEWDNAKENCKWLGGKLLELETSVENEFIKDTVRTLNTGVKGYWVGGYNFNNDLDMEWINPNTCTGCITFGNSVYSIIGDLTEWEKANENCDCLGGKLLELETAVENEFIKDQVRTLDTGVDGYWIGGYNFNNDDDMEWISKQNQVMSFTDMYPGQPNEPEAQPCMMIWRKFDFLWGDHTCNTQLSYICEFEL